MKRFINADSYLSTGQDFIGCNAYSYCNNNPCSYCDENGELLSEVLIGAAVGAIWGGITAGASGSDIGRGIVLGAISGGVTTATAYVAVPLAIIVGATCGGASYAYSNASSGNKVTIGGVAIASAFGAVSGMLTCYGCGISGNLPNLAYTYCTTGMVAVPSMVGTTVYDAVQARSSSNTRQQSNNASSIRSCNASYRNSTTYRQNRSKGSENTANPRNRNRYVAMVA